MTRLASLLAVGTILALAQREYPFFPGRENEARTEDWSKRKLSMPQGWETPAWKELAYVSPDPRISVIHDRAWAAQADRNRRELFRELDVNLADGRENEVLEQAKEWSAIFQDVRRQLSDALEVNHLHQNPKDQVIVDKFSMAVPAAPNKLYKTATLFEGVRCLTHLPRDMAMAITVPTNFDDYVAFRGFLSLIPDFVSSLPDQYPFKIVVHHDKRYKQWGNRWLAANFTSPQSQWITFWDNDDFPAPQRYRWYDQIFESHPEIDVFLAGKWWKKFNTWERTIEHVVARTDKTQPDKTNDTAILEEALRFEPDKGYNDALLTMNATWLSKWRVGSIIGAPLWTGKQFFIEALYDATYEALNHTDLYTPEQVELIKAELEFLGVIEQRTGLDWGDYWVHDGWSTIRRDMFTMIHPPTISSWGEDSLYNWMIAASGFNYFHMVPPFYHLITGVYCIWPEKETFWKLTSDPPSKRRLLRFIRPE